MQLDGNTLPAPRRATHVHATCLDEPDAADLLDAAALQAPGEDVLDQVLGGRALEGERPKHYVAQSTVGPGHAIEVL